jgi:hypothetical protein
MKREYLRVLIGGVAMERPDAIDYIANDIDELKTEVEEVAADTPDPSQQESLETIAETLDEAKDAADDLENRKP